MSCNVTATVPHQCGSGAAEMQADSPEVFRHRSHFHVIRHDDAIESKVSPKVVDDGFAHRRRDPLLHLFAGLDRRDEHVPHDDRRHPAPDGFLERVHLSLLKPAPSMRDNWHVPVAVD